MLIMPSFQKSLIVEQFQGKYLNRVTNTYGIHVFHVLVHGTFRPDGFLQEPLTMHEEYLNTTLIS